MVRPTTGRFYPRVIRTRSLVLEFKSVTRPRLGADLPRVPLQQVLAISLGVTDCLGIGVRPHRAERQGRDGLGVRRVEIHVLYMTLHEEQVIARPAGADRR